ncbi:hypothetical protein [Aeoliella mucimassa]|uniref:hypothetical protein n=1 Tax=Aeoliella mucimassa TaxID=2527972 RepID=UPI0018D491E4|nr:hypothetical protein [Aeoliella mucimassa]
MSNAIFLAGIGQLGVLVATALVPLQLNWKSELASLPKLHRQMYWVYGGYIVLGIVSLGTICLVCHEELASGSLLARAFCCYGLAFWAIRLSLQGVFDVKPHLTRWWLTAGYYLLTVLFVTFTAVYAWGAFGH